MAYPKGTYNIDVTITEGCTIDFDIPSAASSWVHINPQSGGSGRYVLTIDDGNHGDTTVGIYVNGNHCSSHDIEVTSPPVVTCGCGDLTIPETTYTWSATQGSSDTHNFTISSASCITNITKNSLNHFNATFGNGIVTVSPKEPNTGDQPNVEKLTISYTADTNACSSAITLTQNAATCQASTCYTVNGVAVNTSTVAYDAQNATVEWDYVETVITPPDCVPVTTTKHASTSVTLTEVATCNDVEETGQFTWAGHKACNGGTSDMTVNWKVTKQQPAGCGCSCSANLHVSEAKEIGYDKQTTATQVGEYWIDSQCTETMSINSVEVTEGDNWLTVTSNNSTPILATWTKNESTTDTRTAIITVQAKLNGEPCQDSKTIQVIQAKNPISCVCDDLQIVTNEGDIIDWKKNVFLTSVDEEYTFTYEVKQGKEACFEDTIVEFSYDNTDAEYFIINTGTTGDKSYISIKPNPNKDPNQIDIYFNYRAGDKDCATQWGNNFITVIYEPACTCENLLPDDACIERQVPLAAGTYPLGSFGIVGCGEFSGTSTSNQVEDVIITEGDEGYNVSVKLKKYEPTTEHPEAEIGLKIFSLEDGKAMENCEHTYYIHQMEKYVNCNRISNISFVDYHPSFAENSNDYLAYTEEVTGFRGLVNSGVVSSYSAQYDWIDSIRAEWDFGSMFLRGHIYANQSPNPRTNKITITLDTDKLKEVYGICNCIDTITATVTQQGDPSYACTCLENKERKVTQLGEEVSFDSDRVLDACFIDGELMFKPVGTVVPDYASAFDSAQAFYDDYVTVNDWLSIKLRIIPPDASAPGKSRLNIAYKALPNDGGERDYVFKIKFNFDPAKQSQECIWEVKFIQDAATTVTCEELLRSITVSLFDIGATSESKDLAWMDPVLMRDVKLSGETVQSQDCGNGSWITEIKPDEYSPTHLHLKVNQNKSNEHDHSTNDRCAKINIFYIDSEGNRLKINGVECGVKEVTVTQEGYSGDCKPCAEITLPDPTYHNDSTYTDVSSGVIYPAFNDGDGQTERSLFEYTIPNNVYYGEDRCFDLIADTTHHESFVPYSDGKYFNVVVENGKWVVKGKLATATSLTTPVGVDIVIQRRHIASGGNTPCQGSYSARFYILHNE